MSKRIQELQREIDKEKEKIQNCIHSFDSIFYNPEKVFEPYGIKTVVMGSDIRSVHEGYREKLKDRWTRICCKCGKEQHTYKQKPIIERFEPDFN